MAKIIDCVFCSKQGERAKEHLWPIWLQEFVEGGSQKRTETHYTLGGSILGQRIQENGSLVL